MRRKKTRLKKSFLWFSRKDDEGAVLFFVCAHIDLLQIALVPGYVVLTAAIKIR